MKDDNTMMWVLVAGVAWFLWRQGTFDPYIGGLRIVSPVPVNGNGVLDGVLDGVPGEELVNGVSGIADWENIYG